MESDGSRQKRHSMKTVPHAGVSRMVTGLHTRVTSEQLTQALIDVSRPALMVLGFVLCFCLVGEKLLAKVMLLFPEIL